MTSTLKRAALISTLMSLLVLTSDNENNFVRADHQSSVPKEQPVPVVKPEVIEEEEPKEEEEEEDDPNLPHDDKGRTPLKPNNPIDWVKHYYDEEEYFKGIDDYIGIKDIRFYFQLTHSFIQGFDRGMYKDDELILDPDCFGDYYVTKLNEYFYLFEENPFGDFLNVLIPELSITSQFLFMLTDQCAIYHTWNDFMVYCWYQGCWPSLDIWQYGIKSLYVARALNDAAIFWYEGMPTRYVEEEEDPGMSLDLTKEKKDEPKKEEETDGETKEGEAGEESAEVEVPVREWTHEELE